MRKRMLAATAVILSLAGGALANPWADPSGRVSFDQPGEWTTNQEFGDSASDAYSYVITGNASNECHIMAQPNPGTAAASSDAVKRANADAARFTPEVWTQIANGVGNIFPNRSASVVSHSAEGNQWPIQRADIQSTQRLVRASMQLRPGTDILVFCMNYDGTERTDLFDSVIRSVGHPNDAVYFADAAQAQSERDGAAAAEAEAEAVREGLEQAAQQQPQQQQASEDNRTRRERAEEMRRRLRGR